jgi:N utilization substance protein B
MSSARRRSRELALQGLYQWQLSGGTTSQVMKNLSELDGFKKADREFLEAALKGGDRQGRYAARGDRAARRPQVG